MRRGVFEAKLDASGIHYEKDFEERPFTDDEVKTSLIFIKCYAKGIKTIARGTSYGLKHEAENFGEMLNRDFDLATTSYVSNGAFIYAMTKSGFVPYWEPQFGYNAKFKVSFNNKQFR